MISAPLFLLSVWCVAAPQAQGELWAQPGATQTSRAPRDDEAEITHVPFGVASAMPDATDLPIVVSKLVPDKEQSQTAEALRRLKALDVVGADAIAKTLVGVQAPIVRARIALATGNVAMATQLLGPRPTDANLWALYAFEAGRIRLHALDFAAAEKLFAPLVLSAGAQAEAAALPWAYSLAVADPKALLSRSSMLSALLPASDIDAKSRFLATLAAAQMRLGQHDEAQQTQLRRWLEEPVSLETPQLPPVGAIVTPLMAVMRIERLVDAHRSERALAALAAFDAAYMNPRPQAEVVCRRLFAEGMAARNLHRYQASESAMHQVMQSCTDTALVRRAAFVRAKVISIQDGLRAIAPIHAFVAAYPKHSMVDDVLFWGGDIMQRRGRTQEAKAYYEHILALDVQDDQCSEAAWRLSWMAYKQADVPTFVKELKTSLANTRCVLSAAQKARAWYWRGVVACAQKKKTDAIKAFEAVMVAEPMGFYAQRALPKLLKLLPKKARHQRALDFAPPPVGAQIVDLGLCPDALAQQPAFARGLSLLAYGLMPDAAREFMSLRPFLKERHLRQSRHDMALDRCGVGQASLLLSLLLDRAEAHHQAHVQLINDFAHTLLSWPKAQDAPFWRAMYPLAFRPLLGPAERDAKLPMYALQALAREESSFDPDVISWAEAFGLTQLLLTSGQQASSSLVPKPILKSSEQLLDPGLNARLGGALLGQSLRRLDGQLGLALAAYNAGFEPAKAWWKRFAGQPFDTFAEEIPIKETRGYVQRVLRTWGTYRWLYGEAMPTLPIDEYVLPYRN